MDDYIIGLATNIKVYDTNGHLIRCREGEYNDKGALTVLREYYSRTGCIVSEMDYDEFGNITRFIKPGGMRIEWEYDSVYHALPVRINTIASDNNDVLSSDIEYDYRFGLKTKETNANGNYFAYSYDDWGRMRTLYTSYDKEYGTPAAEWEYHNPLSGKWYCITNNKVSFDSDDNRVITIITETDGIGRVERVSKTGLVYDEGSYIKGWNISGIKEYDKSGRVVKECLDDFVAGSMEELLNTDIELSSVYTAYEYDALNRKIKTTLPDGSVMQTEYGIKDGLHTEHRVDDLGNISEVYKDSRGNITCIKKYDSSFALLTWTSYAYSDTGELVDVSDAKGNTIKAEYDMLGKRTSLDSADSGVRKWEYDNRGLLIKESNSVMRTKGESIEYEYDGFNRLVKKTYPTLGETVFVYGTSATPQYAGRLISRSDNSSITEWEYGKLDEIISESKTIKSMIKYSSIGDSVTKVMRYKSNYLGQTEEITYPDGEKIEYSYNEAGQVDGIKGNFEYVKNIGYNKHAQRNHIEYGNGVVSDYTYSNTRRWLTELKTKNSVGEHLQNISYTFDTIGNVLSYTNDCSLSQGDVVAQHYTYDGLYQLTGVQGSIVRGGITSVSYSQTFTYDSIGNMTSKKSSLSSLPYGSSSDMLNYSFTYAYDADYAHRLKSAGGMYYNYNENGNVIGVSDTSYDKQYDLEAVRLSNTTWRYNYDITDSSSAPVKERIPGYERRIEYNDNNMMSHMSGTNEKETFYSYSDDNARVSKYVSSPYSESEQLTFNEYYSLFVNANNKWHGGDVYKSIMLGNSRLVTRIEQGVGNATTEWKKQRTFYYLADHLGSATLITTYKGDVYKRTEYTPYGEKWLESTTSSSSYNFEYGFTGKPLDEETGYYYFGARYYDPMRSVWTTSDPAMSEYFDDVSKGEGGVYDYINLHTYHYAGNNPIRYIDPDGEVKWDQLFSGVLEIGSGVMSLIGAANMIGGTVASGGAAAPITVAGTVVLGGVGIYSLMDGITKVATSLTDQEFKGGMPILTEQIAKDCGTSNDTAEVIGDFTGLAIDVVGASVRVPEAALKVSLGTEKAVKTYNAVNKIINSVNIVNDFVPIVQQYLNT